MRLMESPVQINEPEKSSRHIELPRAMLDPNFYPNHPDDILHRETHISHVFLAGEWVYKIKKPVRFSFLDYSTLAQRKHFLDEELRLNRRLAPSTYVDVLPITHCFSGYQLGGDGAAVEYALRMRRLPERRMLDYLVERGEASTEMMSALAEILSRFHTAARTDQAIQSRGDPEFIRKVWEENLGDIRGFVGTLLDQRTFAAVEEFGRRAFDERHALMLRRAKEGRVRELHGDLHCEHVCFAPEGIQIYDCIEFSADLRCCDVASENAFLLMDLEFRGARELGRAFLENYVDLSQDRELVDLLSFYKCHRALVRGKVFGLQGSEGAETAKRYFDLAYSYTWDDAKPFLLVVAGLTGSGKSTLARTLSRRLGMPMVGSDVTRKTLAGALGRRDTAAYAEGIYTAAMTERTYAAMLDRAEKYIAAGDGAILDGTFLKRAQRAAAAELAARRRVPLRIIWCRSSEELARARLDERARQGTDISDGRWEIYVAQKQGLEPIKGFTAESYLEVDTEPPPAELSASVEQFLRSTLKQRS
jgi:uncharacterized protein